jgi:hypothetical protein
MTHYVRLPILRYEQTLSQSLDVVFEYGHRLFVTTDNKGDSRSRGILFRKQHFTYLYDTARESRLPRRTVSQHGGEAVYSPFTLAGCLQIYQKSLPTNLSCMPMMVE